MPPQEHEPSTLRRRTVAEGEKADACGQQEYTWQQVAAHNTGQSCWVAIHGKVYDITSWMDKHPGGKEILLLAAGRDITDAFESYHPFTDKPAQLLGKFEIGVLSTQEYPVYKKDSGFYKELRTRIGDYFKKNRLDPQSPIPGLMRMIPVLIAAMITFMTAFGPWGASLSFSGRAIFAAVFGVLQALPLLHTMHDCSHLAFGHGDIWWRTAGRLLMDFFAGANMTSWHNQHTIGHHIYTNVFLADPDLPAVVDGDLRRLVSRQTYKSVYRWQWLYLPPLYGGLTLKFRYQDLFETFGAAHNGPIRVNPPGVLMWAELIFTKLFWVSWRILLPLFIWKLPGSQVAALFFIAELFTGYFLAFNFQVSHVSPHCDYPLGSKDGKVIDDEWAVSQVKTSVDYAHGDLITTFFAGALNYQVVHHLFPTISQYHYPAIAPIVQEVCKKYDVPYTILPSVAKAFHAHLKHLHTLGLRGEAAEVHMG